MQMPDRPPLLGMPPVRLQQGFWALSQEHGHSALCLALCSAAALRLDTAFSGYDHGMPGSH